MVSSVLVLPFLSLAALDHGWLDAAIPLPLQASEQVRGAADFDGDGDADLLVLDVDPPRTVARVFYRNAQEYVPGAPLVLEVASTERVGSTLVSIGDLTGDGLPEVVLDRYRSTTGGNIVGVLVCANQGGLLTASTFVPTQDRVTAGVLADADGDGALDLGLMEQTTTFPDARIAWWSPGGATLQSGPASILPHYATSLAAGDIDGDGRADLVAGSGEEARLFLLRTRSDGQLEAPTTLEIGGVRPGAGRRAHVGDLDGDGDADILAAWVDTSAVPDAFHVVAVENRAGALVVGRDQGFDRQTAHSISYNIGQGTLTDLDGDGDLDFCASWIHLLRLENRGLEHFTPAASVPLCWDPDDPFLGGGYGGGVIDLDGDGALDFVGARSLLLGDGTFPSSALDVQQRTHRPVDLDGDGDLDLVTAEFQLLNDGAGAFVRRDWPLPPLPPQMRYTEITGFDDFDGDGRRDVLVGVFSVSADQFIGTHLLSGTSGGGFRPGILAGPDDVSLGDFWSLRLEAHDLDRDGDLDLATRDGWWENVGGGVFAVFHAGWTGTARAIADADGDGNLDLFVEEVTSSACDLWLERGDGAGAFAAELLAHAPNGNGLSFSPAFVDIDGDGDMEVAVASRVPSPGVLLFPNDHGTFAAPLVLDGLGSLQEALGFDDLDGDGLLDVLGVPATGFLPRDYLVWRQTAPLAFAPPERQFGWPADVLVDIDQDGDLDVVGPHTARGRRFQGASGGHARQYGTGSRGSGGVAPVLGFQGPLRPGSTTAALRVVDGLGGGVALVSVGAGPAHLRIGGVLALVRTPLFPPTTMLLGGASGVAGGGAGSLSLAPFIRILAGAHLWAQAFVLDPGASSGMSATNGLELTFGD